MIRFAMRWMLGALAFPLAVFLLPGLRCPRWDVALAAGASLMLIYALVRPLAKLLAGVLSIITLGAAGLAVDAGLIVLCARLFPGEVAVDSFLWAVAAAALVDLVRFAAGNLVRK